MIPRVEIVLERLGFGWIDLDLLPAGKAHAKAQRRKGLIDPPETFAAWRSWREF
jgi:hypothetical protein